MREKLLEIGLEIKIFRDYILLGIVILMGIFTKIYNATQKGKRATLSFILAEGIVSLFVAISVYVITTEFLNLSKFLTFVLCAWGGSLSTLIQSKVEELISSFFESLKSLIKSKIK